jgi:uncharacterized protein YqjF (DUF2071 family)
MASTFLTARWQDLVIVTYAAPREVLEPRVPEELELDERDGRVFVSLVAFDFRECCVRGVRWPGLVNFPEVNLRFYVRERASGRRGVMFVRELVPSRVIAWVARAVYNEPYERAVMSSRVREEGGRVHVEHQVSVRGASLTICARADGRCETPCESSWEHFFKEHSWGYGTDRSGRTLVYEVRHPVWEARCNASATVTGDVAGIYGKEWGWMATAAPVNVMLAVGSGVEVLPCGRM